MEQHCTLVRNLLALFRRTDPDARLIETHISSVLLTGDRVYKLKKPVDFGFLDFSTLEKRREFCREEVRINGRFAPALAYETITIGGTAEDPAIGGEPAVDYAVRMRRFDQANQLDELARAGKLDETLIDRLAEMVAGIHEKATTAQTDDEYGTPARVLHPITENFRMLEAFPFPDTTAEKVRRIRKWSLARHRELEPFFLRRKADGFVRECHGDLHLHNIALVDGAAIPFDAIEFNPTFRWIDVASDLAFLLMDLDRFGERALSNRLLNRYLEITGDYPLLESLRFYQCYRAMVRAKVTGLRLGQEGLAPEERTALLDEVETYLDLALGYTEAPRPFPVLMHGLSGSGKSRAALFAAGLSGGVRIRSDVERMRLFGPGNYTPEATRTTYDTLARLAEGILAAGFPVFVDATFLKRWQRELFGKIEELQLLACRCGETAALERIARRNDISEADREVYLAQKETEEPILPAEKIRVHPVDTGDRRSMERDVEQFLEKAY